LSHISLLSRSRSPTSCRRSRPGWGSGHDREVTADEKGVIEGAELEPRRPDIALPVRGLVPSLFWKPISTRLQASYGPIENEDSGQRVVIDGMLFRNENRDLGGSGDKSRDNFCKRPREGGERTRQVSREVERRAAGRSRRGGTTGRQQEEERTIGRPRERTRRKGARNRTRRPCRGMATLRELLSTQRRRTGRC
jgi:hypothetical protein